MKPFKPPRQVQRFLSAHDQVANLFPRRRDYDTAANRSGVPSIRTASFSMARGGEMLFLLRLMPMKLRGHSPDL
jgi:hypothetical protein